MHIKTTVIQVYAPTKDTGQEGKYEFYDQLQRVVFLPKIEELCNKRQVSQKSCIVKLDPQFDETKKLLVVGGRLQFAQMSSIKSLYHIMIQLLKIDPTRACQSKPCWSRDDPSCSSSTVLAHTRKTRGKVSLEKMSNV